MSAILNRLRGGKTPTQLVRLVQNALNVLLGEGGEDHLIEDEEAGEGGTHSRANSSSIRDREYGEDTEETPIEKRLRQMKEMVYGDGTKEPDEQKADDLAAFMVTEGLMRRLLINFASLPMEARKYTSVLFCNFVRKPRSRFDEYLLEQEDILDQLITGYENTELGTLCGTMLREAIRKPPLLERVLYNDERVWRFFDEFVHQGDFALSSDAFQTLRQMLTENKDMAAEWLFEKYDDVFERYNTLLNSDNYATKRQSIKLLSQLLLERKNYKIMIKYISSKANLKNIMMLLKDRHANIQYEAFHVFKVFVANPQKTDDVLRVLLNNQTKLVAFLGNFQTDKTEEQFNEEKVLLITTLENLPRLEEEEEAAAPAEAAAASS